ncbi:MAG: hypothetical protein QOH38_225, partial [Thermoleophilaceae bacterium]|nr:hypothetical protein [Thermoleophilaceae bacterium]
MARRTAVATALFLIAVSGTATAAPAPQSHGHNDSGGFHDVLPPGTNGFDNAVQLSEFFSCGKRPPHNNDQMALYRDLLYASPGLQPDQLTKYFKDS